MSTPPPRRVQLGGASLRLLRNAAGAARDAVLWPFEARVPRTWVVLRLDRGVSETPTQSPFLEEALGLPRALPSLLECMDRGRRDPELAGVLLRVGRAPLGWARAAALGRAIEALREAGKRVVVYAESTGNAGAWLGALADRFWVAPAGHVDLLGVRVQTPFLRGLLDRLEIRPDVYSAGRFKSAGEILTLESMSDEAREALDGIVEDLYRALLDGLRARRAKTENEARRWIDEGPYLAAEAREIGLVDDLVYPDELPGRLGGLGPRGEPASSDGTGEGVRPLGAAAYLRISRERFRWRPVVDGEPQIAVVPLVGMIRPRVGGSRIALGALRRLAKRPAVRAVVLRVDSPGGSPLASDLIWRAVSKLREDTPVVASLGDTAASGGYYAAMAANEIVAEGTTLTGSIGVVLLSVELDRFLERIGVRFDGVARGRHAGIYAPLRPRTDEERAVLQRQVDALYRDFVDKAAASRGLERASLEPHAQGRVFSGQAAHERGLVDRLGGLDLAVRRARELAGLGEDEGELVWAGAPSGPLSRLLPADPLDLLDPADNALRGPSMLCPLTVPLA